MSKLTGIIGKKKKNKNKDKNKKDKNKDKDKNAMKQKATKIRADVKTGRSVWIGSPTEPFLDSFVLYIGNCNITINEKITKPKQKQNSMCRL